MDVKKIKDDIENKILNSENVIIVPHNNADFDAIASALGISLLAKNLGKQSCIVITDPLYILDIGVKSIIDESKKSFNIINKDKYKCISDKNDLFIAVDVNKRHLMGISELMNDENNIIIIDHHNSGDDTINAKYKYIYPNYSSTSELVSNLLMESNIKIDKLMANYLYAGIYLDTAKLTKNYNANTMITIAKLLDYGANINKVNSFFKEDFYSDRKVQGLVNNVQMINCMLALIVGSEDIEYTREEIAKAADYALKYGADATFAIGKIEDNIVSISGRSAEKIDIGMIMNELGGGGNQYSGAAKLKNITVEETSKKLKKVLKPSYYIED
ncbi:MAG: DHH family phosphoesterase [Bacilli bacterium]|nr:DHH family phosphoesterase [Bacilli bacterium]